MYSNSGRYAVLSHVHQGQTSIVHSTTWMTWIFVCVLHLDLVLQTSDWTEIKNMILPKWNWNWPGKTSELSQSKARIYPEKTKQYNYNLMCYNTLACWQVGLGNLQIKYGFKMYWTWIGKKKMGHVQRWKPGWSSWGSKWFKIYAMIL